jgi:hypothetical protein
MRFLWLTVVLYTVCIHVLADQIYPTHAGNQRFLLSCRFVSFIYIRLTGLWDFIVFDMGFSCFYLVLNLRVSFWRTWFVMINQWVMSFVSCFIVQAMFFI